MVGKHEPVTIYQIMGHPDGLDESTKAVISYYEKGLNLYKSKAFKKALAVFKHILAKHPDDGPSHTMANRCRDFIATPPLPDWNGVFRITSK